jgi:asparagine synthase (glutamine-hydrolysing)
MCGITGYFDRYGRGTEPPTLARMTGTLLHRGPDACGAFEEGGIGLGFRRLAIIDLATGDQPITSEDGNLVLICNGEIYNYRELAAELSAQGHVFRTRSDVEVLLHLYEEHGIDLLHRLNGQFAFALYDRRARELHLARDPFGINPLHYAVVDGLLLFGSEIKAILEHPLAPREVDLTGLDQVLSFPGLVAPRTLFKGIHSLPAGHFLRAGPHGVEVREYWDLIYPQAGEPAEAGGAEPESYYVSGLRDRLESAVRYRLQADVPVGFYLSGGLDSSLIGALIRQVSDQPRHSFSITFPDQEISEARHQRLMAEALQSTHHEIHFSWSEICEGLRRMVYHAECPVRETFNTCALALSAAARQAGVPVVLAGQGADELFAGYMGYRFDQSGLRGGRGMGNPGLDGILEDEIRERLWGDPDLFYEQEYLPLREIKEALYSEELRAALPDFECTQFPLVNGERLRGRHPLHQRSYLDFKLRLSEHLLSEHGDRMTLAHSVEGRYPFLDPEVVRFATAIPPDLKLHHLVEKYVVKQAAAGLVPPAIVEREKFGFRAPGTPYLLQQRVEWIEDLLSYDRIRAQGYFDPDTVERLKQQYRRPGFTLHPHLEIDLLMVVLTFGILVEIFKLPVASGAAVGAV